MTAILRLVQSASVPPVAELTISNLASIAAIYGERGASRVLAELCTRVERILALRPNEVEIGPAGIRFLSRPGIDGAILLHVASMPVAVGGARIVPALRISPAPTDLQPAIVDAAGFHDGMAIAASVYEAALCGRTHLLMQPVGSSSAASGVEPLYWECLSRVTDEDGKVLSPDGFIPVLERLDLIRFYDAHIVRSTIGMLKRGSGVSLGCNISALSAADDPWWSSIIESLSREPALASRLVIEITETALLADPAMALAFIERMRVLGCRIALDDFGKGSHSVDFARLAHPDIIKIDASFLPRGEADDRARQLLSRLIALGDVLAGNVVVEGVENAADLAVAVEGGAGWVQGYHIGMPCRPDTVSAGIMEISP
ncbi:EAL domain-containing protein [Agrobacterium rhizogenes]|nr:EAL domain-containing protein [Rhizobium rhizogenes]NTH66587.1 EAL domain-containing protein [Rhizobium rhizogenes]